jgi:hypothetical protein
MAFTPDATSTPQVRSSRDRPLLTVRDRQMPMLRAGGGHGGAELLVRGSLLVPICNKGSELGVVDIEIER